MTLKCQQAQLPGYGQTHWPAQIAGHVLNFRGQKSYPRILSLMFFEDRNMATTTKLRQWCEYTVGSNSGNSAGYKAQYSINADLVVYDNTGLEIDRLTFFNLMIDQISDTQLDGAATQAMMIQATFAYDRYLPANTAVL